MSNNEGIITWIIITLLTVFFWIGYLASNIQSQQMVCGRLYNTYDGYVTCQKMQSLNEVVYLIKGVE